jgi:hypothetical protein
MVTVCLFGLLALSTKAEAVTIWENGFESGDFSAWSGATGNWSVITSTAAAHSGLRGADIIGPTAPEGDRLWVEIPSLGYRNLQWEYWWKVRAGLEGSDLLVVEWTADNVTWQTLAAYSVLATSEWEMATFSLPAAADDNPNLAFHLLANFNSASDRMAFDDFVLGGEIIPEPATFILLTLGMLVDVRRRPE